MPMRLCETRVSWQTATCTHEGEPKVQAARIAESHFAPFSPERSALRAAPVTGALLDWSTGARCVRGAKQQPQLLAVATYTFLGVAGSIMCPIAASASTGPGQHGASRVTGEHGIRSGRVSTHHTHHCDCAEQQRRCMRVHVHLGVCMCACVMPKCMPKTTATSNTEPTSPWTGKSCVAALPLTHQVPTLQSRPEDRRSARARAVFVADGSWRAVRARDSAVSVGGSGAAGNDARDRLTRCSAFTLQQWLLSAWRCGCWEPVCALWDGSCDERAAT
jgi:hypothetical protein